MYLECICSYNMEQFSVDEKDHYSSLHPTAGNSSKKARKKASNICCSMKVVLAIMIVFQIALLLGFVSACIGYALEISELKSTMASLQMASTLQQQQQKNLH